MDQTEYGTTVTPQRLHLHRAVFLTPPLPPAYRAVATAGKQPRATTVQRKRIHRRLLPRNGAHQRVPFRLAVPSPNLDATIRRRRVHGAIIVNNHSVDGVLMRFDGLQTPETEQVPYLKALIPGNRIHKALVHG